MKRKIQTVCCILTGSLFIASCFWMYSIYRGYQVSKDEYSAIGQEAVRVVETAEVQIPGNEVPETQAAESPLLSIDFSYLQTLNPDICAWIDFPKLGISYPVVQGNDNSYYLNHSVKKDQMFAGSIFMDFRNDRRFQDDNTILYGHNMKNGSMFGLLSRYKKQETWEQESSFYIYTPDQIYQYEIVAYYEVKADISEYQTTFSTQEKKEKYFEAVKEKSWYNTGINLLPEDKLITLSTCTKDASERFLVQGCKKMVFAP